VEETIEGKIVEIFDEIPVNDLPPPPQTLTEATKKANETKDCPETNAKEEMEALAENEELIRDWLDDTI